MNFQTLPINEEGKVQVRCFWQYHFTLPVTFLSLLVLEKQLRLSTCKTFPAKVIVTIGRQLMWHQLFTWDSSSFKHLSHFSDIERRVSKSHQDRADVLSRILAD